MTIIIPIQSVSRLFFRVLIEFDGFALVAIRFRGFQGLSDRHDSQYADIHHRAIPSVCGNLGDPVYDVQTWCHSHNLGGRGS